MSESDSDRDEKLGLDADPSTAAVADPLGLYKIMGLPPTADAAAIRRAYLTLSQAFHTDKHSHQPEDVQAAMGGRFQQLSDAYDILSDPRRRAAYDHSGPAGASRLALVPMAAVNPTDVKRYLDVLAEEARVRRTAKLLSASSSTIISLSVAQNFASFDPAPPRQRAQHPPPTLGDFAAPAPSANPQERSGASAAAEAAPEGSSGGGGANGPAAEAPWESQAATQSSPAAAAAADGAAVDVGDATVPAATRAAPMAAINAQLAEVTIDGVRQYVALLPAAVQAQIQQQLGGGGGGAPAVQGGAGAPATAQGSGGGGMLRRTHPAGRLRRPPLLALLSLQLAYAYNYPIGNATNISLKGTMKSTANQGGDAASVTATMDRILDPLRRLRLAARISVKQLRVVAEYTRLFSPVTELRAKLTAYEGGAWLRAWTLELQRKLSATVTYTGAWALTSADGGGSLSHSLHWAPSGSRHEASASLSTGAGSLAAAASHVIRVSKSLRCSYSVQSHLFGGVTEVSYDAWYTYGELTRVGIGATVTLPYALSLIHGGVVHGPPNTRITQLTILLGRGSHTIRLPVVVIINRHVAALLAAAAAPLTTATLLYAIYQPVRRLHRAREYQRIRAEHSAEVRQARDRAAVEMEALRPLVARRRMTEASVPGGGGLVISKATFGVLHPTVAVLPPTDTAAPSNTAATAPAEDGTPTRSEDASPPQPSLVVDVTDALQVLVHDSTLQLGEGPKHAVPGFFDVDPGTDEPRHVLIEYSFQGRPHRAELPAADAWELPLEEHLVANPTTVPA